MFKLLWQQYTASEATKEEIRKLAAEMGCRPNERARKKNGTVLFAADLSHGVGFASHLFEIITGVERYLDEKSYSLILKHVEKSSAPDQICSLMHSEQADGVILRAGILTKQLATVLVKETLPHLVIGKLDFPSQLSWMDISREAAGQIAANYLLDKGCRRTLYLMGDAHEDQISARRLDGFLEALEEEELSIETIRDIALMTVDNYPFSIYFPYNNVFSTKARRRDRWSRRRSRPSCTDGLPLFGRSSAVPGCWAPDRCIFAWRRPAPPQSSPGF